MLDLTLVIDIGKSHARLLMVDNSGQVQERFSRGNAPVMSPLGYPALDTEGLVRWITATLVASPATRRCARAIVSTHGAAFVGLGSTGLAWAPLDYEFDLGGPTALHAAYQRLRDRFAATLAPDLPLGLNAARQLHWFQHTHPQAWAATRALLPYPQYWAWWLCGVAATEVTSLGCHTQLWLPLKGEYSAMAHSQGWAPLFAPIRPAWDVLGTVRPEQVQALGLPPQCQVHVGVHDSNACLARYLNADGATHSATRHTLVSSGTWTVVMAPNASSQALQPGQDMLCNVSVLGQPTPTARFMGGREFAMLLAGAPADAGTLQDVHDLMRDGVMSVAQGGLPHPLAGLPAGQRSALAALHCAQMTAWLVGQLWQGMGQEQPHQLIVEGPLAANPLYLGLLQALLPACACFASTDALEGTARGAWLLSHWPEPATLDFMGRIQPLELPGLAGYHLQWVQRGKALDGVVAAS
jgi:sugar (pentulose or hexulose) kinase